MAPTVGRRFIRALAGLGAASLGFALVSTGAGGPAAAVAPAAAPDGQIGAWSALGSGVDNKVWSLALGGDGTLYAGGDFRVAGGNPAVGVASWNGTSWAQVGSGLDDSVIGSRLVSSLQVAGGLLYAAGSFTRSGPGPADDTGLAVFDGTTWSAVGGGVRPRASGGEVLTLAVAGTDVVVGGQFDQAGPAPADDSNAAMWNGSSWSNLDGGVRATTGAVDASVRAIGITSSGDIVAAGRFDRAGSVGAADDTNIALWNGTTWSPLAGGLGTLSTQVYALAVSSEDTVYAGGNFPSANNGAVAVGGIAQWNGSAWSSVGTGVSSGAVRSIALDEERGLVYVGGNFPIIGGTTVNRVAVWDQGLQEWIAFTDSGTVGVAGGTGIESVAVRGADVYVGGTLTSAGPVSGVNGVARWTWDGPEGTNAVSSVPGGSIALAGEGFIGVPATGGVYIGGVAAPAYVRDDSVSFSSVVIPSGVYGTVAIEVDGVGGRGVVGTVSLPGRVDPLPSSAPRDVVGVAGDASASVSWSAPASSGSFPVSTYLVTASPGGGSCLTSGLVCTVAGLTNGTAYRFTVKALNGAGWSAASEPSNAVTPVATPKPSITITGAREGNRIAMSGSTTGFGMGGMGTPWTSKSGAGYVAGRAVLVSVEGTFAWSRKAGAGETWRVYFTASGGVRSNTVTIARSRAGGFMPPLGDVGH